MYGSGGSTKPKKKCPKGVRCLSKLECELNHSMFCCPSGTLCKFKELDKCIFYHPNPSNRCRNGLKCRKVKNYECHFFHPNDELPCFFGEDCSHNQVNKCAFYHEKKGLTKQQFTYIAKEPTNSLISTPQKQQKASPYKKDEVLYVRKDSQTPNCLKVPSPLTPEPQLDPLPPKKLEFEETPGEELESSREEEAEVCLIKANDFLKEDNITSFCQKCSHPKISRFSQIFESRQRKTQQSAFAEFKQSIEAVKSQN